MSFKYLYKEPNKKPELKIFDGSIDDFYNCNIMKDILNQPFSYTGHVALNDIFLYFDDCGIKNKDNNLIKYNCNIPSNNPLFQNQLFGNICAIKFENMGDFFERPVDISDKDFKMLCNIFFEVPEKEIYTTQLIDKLDDINNELDNCIECCNDYIFWINKMIKKYGDNYKLDELSAEDLNDGVKYMSNYIIHMKKI